jgi:hypothetical protein
MILRDCMIVIQYRKGVPDRFDSVLRSSVSSSNLSGLELLSRVINTMS